MTYNMFKMQDCFILSMAPLSFTTKPRAGVWCKVSLERKRNTSHICFVFLEEGTDRKTEISQISDKQTRRELMLIDYTNSEEQGSRKEMTWGRLIMYELKDYLNAINYTKNHSWTQRMNSGKENIRNIYRK